MGVVQGVVRRVLRASVVLDRRVGAYLVGIVLGFPDERQRGNSPHAPGLPGGRGTQRADLQSGDAERRAVATQVMTGGTTS